MEGVEPSGPKPPVSETGASTSFRHIRTRSRAGARLAVTYAAFGGCGCGRATSSRAWRRASSCTTFAGRGGAGRTGLTR